MYLAKYEADQVPTRATMTGQKTPVRSSAAPLIAEKMKKLPDGVNQ